MASRLSLHEELINILGSNNVYYQPPATIKMSYPCIVYSVDDYLVKSADNIGYGLDKAYSITIIDRKPDNIAIEKLLQKPKCRFIRQYTADGLYHDLLKLYY